MDVNAIDLTGAGGDSSVELERLAAGSVKRVVRGNRAGAEPVGDRAAASR